MEVDKALKEEHFFNQLAERQEESWWGHRTFTGQQRQKRRARLFAELLSPVRETTKILEIGCGSGDFTVHLLENLPPCAYFGMDISQGLLDVAKRRILNDYVTFLKGNVEELDAQFGTFDVVIGASILHHLNVPKTLQNIHRVLPRAGRILLMEPNMRNPQVWLERNVKWVGRKLQNTEDETAFYKREIEDHLKKAGFREVSAEPFDFMHPLIPKSLFPLMSKMCLGLEKIPALREFAGSLLIQGRK